MFDSIGSDRVPHLNTTHLDLHVGSVLCHVADDDVTGRNSNARQNSHESNVIPPHDLCRDSLASEVLNSLESVIVQVCVQYLALSASPAIDAQPGLAVIFVASHHHQDLSVVYYISNAADIACSEGVDDVVLFIPALIVHVKSETMVQPAIRASSTNGKGLEVFDVAKWNADVLASSETTERYVDDVLRVIGRKASNLETICGGKSDLGLLICTEV